MRLNIYSRTLYYSILRALSGVVKLFFVFFPLNSGQGVWGVQPPKIKKDLAGEAGVSFLIGGAKTADGGC